MSGFAEHLVPAILIARHTTRLLSLLQQFDRLRCRSPEVKGDAVIDNLGSMTPQQFRNPYPVVHARSPS
jgi:hypothetical protein